MQPYNYFSSGYNPYPQYQNGFGGQSMQSPIQAQQSQPPVSTMGGFIPVQNENEARMYRLAPGTSATFIDENAPYCYTKTEGVSQLDRPIFKRFRLVEETDTPQDAPQGSQTALQNQGIDLSAYALKADLDVFSRELDTLHRQLETLTQNQAKKTAPKSKKEDDTE